MSIKQLILGGARSGKSTFAEQESIQIATNNKAQLIYLATAHAGDTEMQSRIKRHQARRSADWQLIEEGLDIAAILDKANNKQCILIDCLTLWLSNCLHRDCWSQQKQAFVTSLQNCSANVVMVSNEVGSGIVPMGELSRLFVDESGWLHQELARHCDKVTLVVAGLPMPLKEN